MASCQKCKYLYDSDNRLICRRYPVTVNKTGFDWCGEFKDIAIEEPVPVNTPIEPRSVTVSPDELELARLKLENESLQQRKKPGRPVGWRKPNTIPAKQ
jgi:hypothetical protein